MIRHDKRGGELDLLTVLRRDLSVTGQPEAVYPPRRVVVMVLTAVAAVLLGIQIVQF